MRSLKYSLHTRQTIMPIEARWCGKTRNFFLNKFIFNLFRQNNKKTGGKKMYLTYHLNSDELSQDLLESIKSIFPDKSIEIFVCESDDTAYLLSSSNNRQMLLSRLKDINSGKNLVIPDQEQFQ